MSSASDSSPAAKPPSKSPFGSPLKAPPKSPSKAPLKLPPSKLKLLSPRSRATYTSSGCFRASSISKEASTCSEALHKLKNVHTYGVFSFEKSPWSDVDKTLLLGLTQWVVEVIGEENGKVNVLTRWPSEEIQSLERTDELEDENWITIPCSVMFSSEDDGPCKNYIYFCEKSEKVSKAAGRVRSPSKRRNRGVNIRKSFTTFTELRNEKRARQLLKDEEKNAKPKMSTPTKLGRRENDLNLITRIEERVNESPFKKLVLSEAETAGDDTGESNDESLNKSMESLPRGELKEFSSAEETDKDTIEPQKKIVRRRFENNETHSPLPTPSPTKKKLVFGKDTCTNCKAMQIECSKLKQQVIVLRSERDLHLKLINEHEKDLNTYRYLLVEKEREQSCPPKNRPRSPLSSPSPTKSKKHSNKEKLESRDRIRSERVSYKTSLRSALKYDIGHGLHIKKAEVDNIYVRCNLGKYLSSLLDIIASEYKLDLGNLSLSGSNANRSMNLTGYSKKAGMPDVVKNALFDCAYARYHTTRSSVEKKIANKLARS